MSPPATGRPWVCRSCLCWRILTQLTSELDKHEVGDVVKLTVYRYYDANGKWLYNYEKLELDVQLEILDQKTEMKK